MVLDIAIGIMKPEDKDSLTERLHEFERQEIIDALERSGWVKAKAARLLGITERMIGYKIRKYEIGKEVQGAHMQEKRKSIEREDGRED